MNKSVLLFYIYKIFIHKIALVLFKIKFLLILKIFIKLEDSLN